MLVHLGSPDKFERSRGDLNQGMAATLLVVALPVVALPVVALPAVAAARNKCSGHTSRGACLLFRHQHECVWDMPSRTCTNRVACGDRAQAACETELTTGASWDSTTNMCFFDAAQHKCRFADECFGLSVSACKAASCSFERMCTPMDMRSAPGPNVCDHVCVAPRASSETARSPAAMNRTLDSARAHAQTTTAAGGGPVVKTTSGTLRGLAASRGVESFLGVPFAEAPVAELRWAPPKAISWDGTYDATSMGAGCNQVDGYYRLDASRCQGYTRGAGACAGYSESCLNMNIYTPSSTSGSRAVMVWIHGGCFVSGSAAGYDGTTLASTHDVVVAVVQYRLGAFGFLGGEELRERDPSGSTGNWGLLDNIASLEWLQKNLAAFGGDPSRVTIFGESSGAGSVSQLLGIPSAWPFFSKAIMESGTAAFWTYIPLENAQQSYAKVVSAAGCEGASKKLDCLLNAASNGLSGAVSSVPCRDACNWAPVVDGVLVAGKTLNLAKAGELRPKTPIIAGFNLNDGAMFVPGYPFSMHTMSKSSLKAYFSDRFGEERVGELSSLFPVPGAFPGSSMLSAHFYAAQRCETDFSYACTALWLTAAAPSSSVWVYQFSEPTGANGLSVHGDEIAYVFGTIAKPSAGQAKVSKSMMAFWTNFAKGGDPNGDSSLSGTARVPLEWPAWTSAAGAVINLTATPSIASVPSGSFVGCPFFDEHWDFYSGCLPP